MSNCNLVSFDVPLPNEYRVLSYNLLTLFFFIISIFCYSTSVPISVEEVYSLLTIVLFKL